MDCRFEARVQAMVEQLAREHQQELAAAGTLVDLEELTCQIGDEVGRRLAERELNRRSRQLAERPANCPDCGNFCTPMPEPEPVVLAGLRGELAYSQPRHYCDRCRRSFFPSGGVSGPAGAQHGHDERSQKGGVGRRQQR